MQDGAREAIVHEDEFRRIFAERAREHLRFLNLMLRRDTRDWVKRHYTELVARSHALETFLDDYDARNNKQFCFPTELVASLRGFGLVSSALKHLLGRFPRYNVALDADDASAFFGETEHTVRFLNKSILGLIHGLLEELQRLGITTPDDAREDATVGEESQRLHLPHNIDEEDILDEDQRIAEVATKYLAANDRLNWAGQRRVEGKRELRDFVLANVDEERARTYESLVHSIQSKYDTYIQSTATESKMQALPRLRGHVAMSLHLLEMGTQLVHFYERHENDIRFEEAKARIARIVDKTMVLDRIVNYAYYFGSRVLASGRRFAEEALAAFLSVQRLELQLPEGQTLHARPISLIVKIVHHYGTHVEMELDGESCSAASIMEMIMMVGNRPHCRAVVLRGDVRPLRDVKLLFESGLGELGLDVLPSQLDYLKA
jgi:hypothetical protein